MACPSTESATAYGQGLAAQDHVVCPRNIAGRQTPTNLLWKICFQAQVLQEARARHMNTACNLSSTHLSTAATWKYRRLKSK